MVAVLAVRMVVHPAGSVVAQVGNHDERKSSSQHPVLMFAPVFLGPEESHAGTEKQQGLQAVMVPLVAMPERKIPDPHGQEDHEIFKEGIVNDVDPENRQAV